MAAAGGPGANFIDAFKAAQDFAAKKVSVPDGQHDWLAWHADPDNPERKRKLEKVVDDRPRPKRGEEEEVFVPVTHVKTTDELKVWAELKDAEGQTYWFNAATGERTRKRPRMQEDDDAQAAKRAAAAAAAAAAKREQSSSPPPPPPQKWTRTVDPLTRRPTWLSAEDKLVVSTEPRPHPWRAVAVSDGPRPFYWWNVDTKETTWDPA